jgi:hypothetical protein
MNRPAIEAKPISDRTAVPASGSDLGVDYRPAVCRWENDLFEQHPQALRILDEDESRALIGDIFAACGLPAPALELVPGFTDPEVGGYADVARNRILIERGFLHAYLVLHEVAHILVPEDRLHGSSFVFVVQTLYRIYLGIPEASLCDLMHRHGLPGLSALRN